MGIGGAEGGTLGNCCSVSRDIRWHVCEAAMLTPYHHSYSCTPTPTRPIQPLTPGFLSLYTIDILGK